MNETKNKTIIEKMFITDEADSTTKYICENIDKSLIIFCNPISGNKEGKKILKMMNHYMSKENYRLIDFQYLMTGKNYQPVKALFFELINKEDNDKGQKLLKHVSEKCKINKEKGLPENFWKIKVLIAGGDGSVLSMVDSFVKHEIDLNFCIFGHIPLGTANDLSNSLGFSDHINLSEGNMDDLYSILNQYYNAQFGKVDIWKIVLQLDSTDGEILINKKSGKIQLKDENGNKIKRYQRSFINYISLGYDARVGYNFDAHRTNSRCMNKCRYFIEGTKKMCCRKTIPVQGFIDTFIVYDSDENSINQESFFSNNFNDNEGFSNITLPNPIQNQNIQYNNTNNTLIINNQEHKIKFSFVTEKYLKAKNLLNDKNKYLILQGDPCSLIFQNISNYMSGVKNIWGKGKNHLSLGYNGNDNQKYNNKLLAMASQQQKFDDKMLEVFTFDNGLETGLEKVVGGQAKKIYHGRGPIEIKFVETPKYEKNDKTNRIYFNLDGEFFNLIKPISLKIELNREYCNGQLPFLIGNN